MDIQKQIIRTMVRGVYDLQKLRIETGNRIVANFREKLGLNTTDADDTEAQNVLKDLEMRYRRITDGITLVTRRRKFEYDGVISNYTELCLVGHYLDLLQKEQRQFRDMERALEGMPIWDSFLKDVKGIGPALAGVIVSEIDIHKARYPSSIWRYAGLDVAEDGRGRSRKKEHLVDVEYADANGEAKTRRSITFNPFLKTKLMGVAATSFLRVGDSPYRKVYDDTRHRLENHATYKDASKGHRHNMAMRKMVKVFLMDLYVAWRKLEGLPVSEPYHVAKLGMRSHA